MSSGSNEAPVNISFDNFEWKTRLNSTKIVLKHELARVRVDIHPLQRFSSQTSRDAASRVGITRDPVGSLLDGNDPLSLLQKKSIRKMFDDEFCDDPDDGAGSSSSTTSSVRRRRIRNPYGIKESIDYDDYNTDITIDIHRLGIDLSYHMAYDEIFISHLRRLKPTNIAAKVDHYRSDLELVWEEGERVEALRIVILCAKLLLDTENPVLYPIKYAHFADVFDKFGNLVFKRLKNQDEPPPPVNLRQGRTPGTMRLEPVKSARETCLNWFSKIASIRELVPRLYTEAAILRCYVFVDEDKIFSELKKLIRLTRCVGDLVVNLYLRCYLCQVAMQCKMIIYNNFFRENFDDFMIALNAFLAREDLGDKINLNHYLETLLPGLEWLLKGVLDRDYHVQDMYFTQFQQLPHNSIMLLIILECFETEYVMNNINHLLEWMVYELPTDIPKYKHMIYLGRACEKYREKSGEKIPEKVLAEVWNLSECLNDTKQYFNVLDMWLPMSENCLPSDRVNSILKAFGLHLARDLFGERHTTRVENIIRNLTRYADDFFMLLISEHFLPFLNKITKVQLKVNLCKIILEALVQRSDYTFICDSVTLDSVMVVAKTVHDSIRASTVDDERKQIGNLLVKFIRLVRFRDELNRQLDFYVNARKDFYHIEPVYETLVHCVNFLCSEQLKSIRGNHDPSSLEFAQSCVAYNFITIPSINSPITRLQLLIISGQVALANQCHDMATSYFAEAINIMNEFKKAEVKEVSTERVRRDFTYERTSHTEILLKSYALQLMSILIVLPDDPDGKSVFRLCARLIRAIRQFEWKDPMMQPSLSIMLMRMYAVGYQEVYPYHFLNVDSNDTLYGPDAEFRQKIDTIITNIMHDVLRSIVQLAKNDHFASQMIIIEEFLAIVLSFGDLTNKSLAVLTVQLWNFCQQIPFNTKVFMKQWISMCLLMSPPESPHEYILKKILTKLKLEDIPLLRVVPTTLSI